MTRPRVAIVGGGLAGMAAAAYLVDANFEIELIEARRQLGGRAASFRDPATGALVDYCQHVSMGCCTQLADFCKLTGIASSFERHRTLYFVCPDGRASALAACRWLPPPLHLAPALLRMNFLPLADRIRVAKALLALRAVDATEASATSMRDWLLLRGQTTVAMDRFWSVVLVSALGDTLDRVSLAAGRKVFVDGFMSSRDGYEVLIPHVPLSRLFDEQVRIWLTERGVRVLTGTPVESIDLANGKFAIKRNQAETQRFDAVVIATAWRQVSEIIGPTLCPALPFLDSISRIESSPITGVHLWFDRSITQLPHAVLIGRLGQWLFSRGEQTLEDGRRAHYYQVVISASRELATLDRTEVARR